MRRRRLWLAGGLVFGLLGCSSVNRTPENRFAPPPPPRQTSYPTTSAQTTRKPKEEPSKVLQAKPSTCVSMAEFYANCATDANRPDAERQRFAEQARTTYRRALQQDPKYLPAFLGLGRLAERLDEREEAVAVYNEALTHHSNEATLWFERGVSLSRMRRFDDALASYQRAAQIDSKNKSYNVSAGYMLAILGRHEEAVTWMTRVMPEASARYNVAVALRRQGKEEPARQQFALALQADPKHKPTLEALAESVPASRVTDDRLQQAQYAQIDAARSRSEIPAAVVIAPSEEKSGAATLPTRPTQAVEKKVVSWNKAEPQRAASTAKYEPTMPLIPVLSEHWETRPAAPKTLFGPPPASAAKPRPLAKLGFEEPQ